MAQISPGSGRFHAVQFHKSERSLATVVGRFLAEGVRQTEPAIVIATPRHIAAIERELTYYALDVRRLKQLGDLIVLDARETLDTLMLDRTVHTELFQHVIGRMLDETARIHPDRTIRAYGEMVNLLWKDGMSAAALRLESLWDRITQSRHVKLLCGYAAGNVYGDATVGRITGHHTHLVADTGEAATIN